jgi:uridine kinase
VAGASHTGFALATVKDVLRDRTEPIQLLSYVFWYHPPSTDDESDSVLATPDYVSNRHNRFVPPWYKKAGGPIIESDRPRLEFSGPGARVTQISIDTSDVTPALTMESEALLHTLSRAIKSRSTTSDHYTIVIAGPAGIGKSRLATRLKDELSNATHLPLDASIKESAFRDGAQINGCQLQAYDLATIEDWAKKLAAEQEFIISPLDHALRRPHGSQTVDGKSKFRLIEWIFAGSPQAIPGDLRIVIDANDDARFHFWFDRYERVRGMQVTSEVRKLINERLDSTAEEIAPHLENWDIRFNIGADRTVLRIDSKCREFSEEVLFVLATAPIKSAAKGQVI